MPFPTSERVRFSRNQIRNVVCQLRFPTILKVEASLPVDFQECIRDMYPQYQERVVKTNTHLPADIENLIPEQMKQLLAGGGRHFDFTSVDGKKTITLNKEFLSLTTTEYGEWNAFIGDLKGALEALIRIYRPALFMRIGLRYQNVILRSEIDQSEADWSELINPYMAGILADGHVAQHVNECMQVAIVRLSDGLGHVRIQQGLVIEQNRNEPAYLIDSDFYTEHPQETGNELDILDQLHRQAGHFFRWAIEPRLHDALVPELRGSSNNR
ncbi:MAG: TIGR04255 family protein [Caldilineaceae bacterium]|uniref:TIGR04255 family protein n=1 Tax=Caldilineaceae bacterium SB0661_bin_32 TaxID=2605255 RepID=A0A6B1D5H3_9CHLR|nr:TIGR04255 family protein [Caldilineaceae bacterium]MDE0631061.1 TIGR04255 family protein [Caldilineaceae bacterium]MXZ20523.1 TIGR04255 family protein [Caldilineaceae bacterium SB0665_bin_25]MYC94856.1 TIGR04255 family protein [Caldilineaceae bacterium SB0661_bin_32]